MTKENIDISREPADFIQPPVFDNQDYKDHGMCFWGRKRITLPDGREMKPGKPMSRPNGIGEEVVEVPVKVGKFLIWDGPKGTVKLAGKALEELGELLLSPENRRKK